MVVKTSALATSARRMSPSATGNQLNFFWANPFSQLGPLQLDADTYESIDAGDLRVNGNISVGGNITSNVRATNVLFSQSGQQPDETVQDTLTALQNTISLIQSSIAQLPTVFHPLISPSAKLSYSLLTDVPNLNVYATKTEVTTTLQGYQSLLNDSTNTLPYSYISGVPNFVTASAVDTKLQLYATLTFLTSTLLAYQTVLNDSNNMLPYSYISGVPNFALASQLERLTNRHYRYTHTNLTIPSPTSNSPVAVQLLRSYALCTSALTMPAIANVN
jgi:hypothetical protein